MTFIRLFGGLALFIYGMLLMGNALEKVAGEKLEKTLEFMTGNLFKGIALGAVVTGIIQSSSATTVMVVGFVNAGIMSLRQAAGVIMGANIGTTVTAQLLRLDSSGQIGQSLFFQIIKPSNLAYIAVFAGLLFIMLSKKRKAHDFGEILLGLGILFVGMSIMENAVSVFRDVPAFKNLFLTFSNPIFGVLAGLFVTAVIQSSSASVGILQALATTGAVTYSSAIPIILGQNIGTCVTALLSSIGASKNAKRAAMIHFYFNLIGSGVFLIGIYTLKALVGFPFWSLPVTKGAIANFHTVFNIATTLLFVPFHGFLVVLAERTIRPKKECANDTMALLDERFYTTPSIALDQCRKTIIEMGAKALENVRLANNAVVDGVSPDLESFRNNEHFLDRAETRLSQYLIGIKHDELSEEGHKAYTEMFHSVSDFERIGDYAENLIDQYNEMQKRSVAFSEDAHNELTVIRRATEDIIALTLECYRKKDYSLAHRIEPLEEVIDLLKETLKTRHITRLQNGLCTIDIGVPFLEVIHNYEKISDHCSNIAVYVIESKIGSKDFDPHEYIKRAHEGITEEYKFYYNFYADQYYSMITSS